MNRFNNSRRAGVTIEFALALVLATGVIILLLGVFNSNIEKVNNNSGFQNLFNRDEVTDYDDTATSYQNSQVSAGQETTAAQALEAYIDQMQSNIDALVAKQPLTAEEQVQLAMNLVQKSIMEQWETNTSFSAAEIAAASANGIGELPV